MAGYDMSTLCLSVRIILILGLFLNLRYAPNATSLMRDEGQSFAFANFAMNNFHYLNITPFIQIMVDAFEDCGLSCLQHSSCLSFNVAALSDITKQKTLCELLPSDKYRESHNFVASQQYHHFSITTPCHNEPCKNGATCLVKYEDDSYECACVTGYAGKSCETEINFHWRLDGTDEQITLRGAAMFTQQDGQTVLFLNGSTGTFAETLAFPIRSKNLTICVWIKRLTHSNQPVYGDWSARHSFRLYVENDHFCLQVRDGNGRYPIHVTPSTGSNVVVPTNRWSHVAITWNRAYRRARLFFNGEKKQEIKVAEDKDIDFVDSGHSVYDIGLKRDGGTVAHAYFSDLMVFYRELQFSPSENVNEIKNAIFLTHPPHNSVL
ncbi:uncharacterized protein [Montipora foliosa]